jgi:hypothetical protein
LFCLVLVIMGKKGQASSSSGAVEGRPKAFLALPKPPNQKCVCARCGVTVREKAGGVNDFGVTPDGTFADRDCYETYLFAFRHKGSFNDVVALCKADPAINVAFTGAMDVKKAIALPDFDESSVYNCTGMKLAVSRSLIAVPRAQYIEMNHGVSPEDAEHRLETLQDLQGVKYKGVLCLDPANPWLRYTYQRDVGVEQHDMRVVPSQVLYNTQATEHFDANVKQQEAKQSAFFAKFRTCNLTLNAMQDRAWQVAIVKGLVDPAATPHPGDALADPTTTPLRGIPRVPLAFATPIGMVNQPSGEDECDSDLEPDAARDAVAGQQTMVGGSPMTKLSLASGARESSRSPRRASSCQSGIVPSLRRGPSSVAGSASSRVVARGSERFERFSGTPADRQSNAIA